MCSFLLPNFNRDCLPLAAAQDLHRRGLPHDCADQSGQELVGIGDRLVAQADQDIAHQQAALCSRAPIFDAHQQQAGLVFAASSLALRLG